MQYLLHNVKSLRHLANDINPRRELVIKLYMEHVKVQDYVIVPCAAKIEL